MQNGFISTSAGTAFSEKLKIFSTIHVRVISAYQGNRSSPLRKNPETSTRHNQILAAATIRSRMTKVACCRTSASMAVIVPASPKSKAVDRSWDQLSYLSCPQQPVRPGGLRTHLHHRHAKPQRIQIARTTKIDIKRNACLRKLKFSLQSTC